jgi:hypothetical protein
LVVRVAAVLKMVPAGQAVAAVQLAELLVEVKVLAAHGVHVRSVKVLPSASTAVPGTHTVLTMQGVAGSLSLSQVPGPHVTGGAEPPTQEVPAVHAAHVAGVLPVGGAVW